MFITMQTERYWKPHPYIYYSGLSVVIGECVTRWLPSNSFTDLARDFIVGCKPLIYINFYCCLIALGQSILRKALLPAQRLHKDNELDRAVEMNATLFIMYFLHIASIGQPTTKLDGYLNLDVSLLAVRASLQGFVGMSDARSEIVGHFF